jgi:hypothetical protein
MFGGLGIQGLGLTRIQGRTDTYPYVNNEARLLTARFTTQPTAARKALIDTLVGSLKTGGVWSKLDALYVLAAADSQAARQNWIQNLYNAVVVSAPVFEADRGYTGAAGPSYLNTAFNPTTATTPKFTQDSASLGVWARTNAAENTDDIGNSTAFLRSRTAANTLLARVNQASNSSGPAAIATSVGHSMARRPDNANIQTFKNGVLDQSTAVASTALSSSDIWICRGPVGGLSTKQISAAHFGQTLSDAEVTALYDGLNTYLTAVGA